MVVKKCAEDREVCWITFSVAFENAQRVYLVGEWSGWQKEEMRKRKDGSFWITKRLKKGSYRFKYLVDDREWYNDPQADHYVPNPFGGTDSVVVVG